MPIDKRHALIGRGIGQIDLSNGPQDGDVLVWDATERRWVAQRFVQNNTIDMDSGGVAGFYGRTQDVDDDASASFDLPSAYAFVWVLTNFDRTARAHFISDLSALEVLSAGTSCQVDTSIPGTNPDVDGDLNVWMSDYETVNVRNRLGDQRSVTVFAKCVG